MGHPQENKKRESAMNIPATGSRRRYPAVTQAFSLIELLVTIGIILALFGLLLPALSFARERAKVIEAKKDVVQLEAALSEYYATYRRWPPLLGDPIGDSPPTKIAGEMAELLISGSYDAENNPRRLTFMQFRRINESGSPVSPWGDEEIGDSEESDEHYYWVILDSNCDNVLIGCDCDDVLCPIPPENLRRSLIVWTANPNIEPGDEGYIIGSWKP